MGFRSGSYATVWEIDPRSDSWTKGRISISRKNKQTDEYETDFSGYVSFVGTNAASKAAKLKVKDRIRIGDVDVNNRYDKEKDVTYTNFKIFSFDGPDELEPKSTPRRTVDDGFIDVKDDDEGLPF